MRCIIIAAGSGKRITQSGKNLPKALLNVNDKTILERQVSLFRKNNINDIVVITGPYGEKFDLKNITYVNDSKFVDHDILGSLMEARQYIEGEVLITYSDILFEESILLQIVKSKSDIGIALDPNWEKSYANRTQHPKSEAENVLLDYNDKILLIRKNIQDGDKKVTEFIGVIKLSPKGAEIFVKKFAMLERSHVGKFHAATSLSKAYLTDMIQELIDSKINVSPIIVSGKWCEIDTLQDLEHAQGLFS